MTKKTIYKAPIGTQDILPNDHDYFTYVKKIIRYRFRQAGFRRISTPVFEETNTFHNALGVDTDIIKRELYSFDDPRGKESLSLRPELTTGIVRSFIEQELYKGPLPVELYSLGRCFRFERPQSRTKREFWQFGAEILGESDPAIDAQLIYLAYRILSDLGLSEHCELKINTIGNPEDRQKFIDALANFYSGKERSLSLRLREKLEQGDYLALLNPTTENEEILAKMAPKITDFLSPDSKEFLNQTLSYLNTFGIEYTIDPGLIRPIDYYSHTTFEFREKAAHRNKILVGGRYDGLMKKMNGEDLGGCGFAAGLERVIALMKAHEIPVPKKDTLQIYVAATGVLAKKEALPILVKLREHGFHAVGVLGKTRMEDQLARATKFNVPYSLVMGDVEIRKGEVIVREMKRGRSTTIKIEDIIPHMEKLFKDVQLDNTNKIVVNR
ncbi:histidine--tRNA ligase [bacterium DOLZORAL124_38_8]|nr:MAG: histidine--tRNA ligase [bacterium DOLZORAL124_38_8]